MYQSSKKSKKLLLRQDHAISVTAESFLHKESEFHVTPHETADRNQ